MTAERPEPDAIAHAALRTLTADEALAFGATIGAAHATRRSGGDTELAATLAARPGDAASGPVTVDVPMLPRLLVAEAGAGDPREVDLIAGRVLGEGGMGVVHLARQRSLQRDVAIKRLREAAGAAEHAYALLREATFTGYLEHPSIVPVHALGRDDAGRPLLVMKRVEGTTLAALLREPGHPAWARAGDDRLGFFVRALRGVCDALSFAHARGVLHRDVKPANIMLGAFGEVYLLDWGVAHRIGDALTDEQITGTPAYMAPEMLRPGSIALDARTDVYLVGATLHECLVGEPPHVGSSMQEVLISVAISSPDPYPEETPIELAEIARRAMHCDRAQRFSSAEALGRALADFERHRAAADIAKVAEERLAELERALPIASAEVIEPLFHECRFGFEQALRAWPENARAREHQRRALVAMCRYELRQGNRTSAAGLLAAIADPPPELADGLAALDRELASQAEARERLRRLEHEMDPRVAERERRIAVGIVAGVLVLLAAALTGGYALHLYQPTPGRMFTASVIAVAVVAAALLRFHRNLFRNRVSRIMGLTVGCIVIAVITNRALGVSQGRGFGDITSGDSLLISLGAAIASLTLRRVYLVPATLFFLASLICPPLGALGFVPLLAAALISSFVVARSPAHLRAPLVDDGAAPTSRAPARPPPRSGEATPP